jgi:hypothetical protein
MRPLHNRIDPLGFTLINFSATDNWLTWKNFSYRRWIQLHVKAAMNHLPTNGRTMKSQIEYAAASDLFLST